MLTTGQLVEGRYKIIEKLGEGGMGAVWKAIDTKLDDEVVIKLPLNHLDQEILRRFGHEAKAMRKYSLDCPHILNIQDVGSLGEVPWYVMRFLPGGSIRDQALTPDQSGSLQWNAESFTWLTQIASALDYLHRRECFHRDVKPENILFSSDGVSYLVDFGIVKNATETTTMMTEQGKAIGTLAYMAPETLEGEGFTGQSDQYALAVTLYESISGNRPFSGTTYFSLFKSIQKGHHKLSELHSSVSSAASQVIDQALSQQPADRFGSCGEFAARFIDGLSDSRAERPSKGGVVTPVRPVNPNAPERPEKKFEEGKKERLFEPPKEANGAFGEVPNSAATASTPAAMISNDMAGSDSSFIANSYNHPNLPSRKSGGALKWILGGCGCLTALVGFCFIGFFMYVMSTFGTLSQEARSFVEDSTIAQEHLGSPITIKGEPILIESESNDFVFEVFASGPKGSGTATVTSQLDDVSFEWVMKEASLDVDGEKFDLKATD